MNTTSRNNISWIDVPKSIWYFLENDKKKFIIAFFVLLLIFFYELVPVFIVGKIVDFFTNYTKGESLRVFYLYSVLLGLTWIIASIIRLKSKNIISVIGQKVRTRVRIWGFERLTEFSLEWHNKENTGNKIQRIFTGADGVSGILKLLRRDLLKIAATVIGIIIFFIFTDFKFVIFVVIYAGVFLYTEFYFSKKVLRLSNEFNKFNQTAGGVYVESASNMLSIKALGGEHGVLNRVSDKENVSRDISIKKANTNTFKWTCLQFVSGIALSVFIFLTGFEFLSGGITIGMILVFFTYFNRLGVSLADVSDLYSDLIDLRSDIGNVMPIFRETDFIKTGNEKFPESWDKIEVKNANMEYVSGQVGLKNFNLILKRNLKVGIAGSSGSGKSTLAKVILGLYAFKDGEFKVGNQDYYSMSHSEILKNITVVLQETELFNLSLGENITMMRPLDRRLLKQAIDISELGPVIDRLPEGLDATIGEKGYMLSGGERQRLGIARAIYKNAPIIILDEATSSLDSETESKVMAKLLGEYGKDKTFLIIAHRLGTLKYTNNIVVMETGQAVEQGSYEELIKNKKSIFYKMNKEHNK